MTIIVIAAAIVIIRTTLRIRNATLAQKLLLARRESLPDNRRIISTCVAQLVVYVIFGGLEIMKFVLMTKILHAATNRDMELFYILTTLMSARIVAQQICMTIFAAILLVRLEEYNRAESEIAASVQLFYHYLFKKAIVVRL